MVNRVSDVTVLKARHVTALLTGADPRYVSNSPKHANTRRTIASAAAQLDSRPRYDMPPAPSIQQGEVHYPLCDVGVCAPIESGRLI